MNFLHLCLILFTSNINAHLNSHAGGGNNQVKANMNMDHVLEHLDGVINKPKEQMTQEEQNFYYFKLHDYDNNNKLDGLELVSAFAHSDEKHDDQNQQEQVLKVPRMSDDDLIKLIDEIMRDEDIDKDGFISYNVCFINSNNLVFSNFYLPFKGIYSSY